jgi:hypothetical protein
MPHDDCLNLRLGDYFERRRNRGDPEAAEAEEPDDRAGDAEGGAAHEDLDTSAATDA